MVNQPFNKPNNTGFTHLLNAARFSGRGLKAAVLNEAAFRQELLLLAVLLPTGAWRADSVGEFVLLLCACLLLLVIELLNSAIEAVVDRIGTEQHKLSGMAKDYGSAAVMLAVLGVGIIWGYIVLG